MSIINGQKTLTGQDAIQGTRNTYIYKYFLPSQGTASARGMLAAKRVFLFGIQSTVSILLFSPPLLSGVRPIAFFNSGTRWPPGADFFIHVLTKRCEWSEAASFDVGVIVLANNCGVKSIRVLLSSWRCRFGHAATSQQTVIF
jgi:hypothetical protein